MSIHKEAPPDARPPLGTGGAVTRLTLIGVAVAGVVRRLSPLPPFPPKMSRLERLAATASEYTMYGLMFALPLVGWGMLSAARYPIVLYGSLRLPFIVPHNAMLYAVLRETHRTRVPPFPDVSRPLRGNPVSHADRPGRNAVTDGALECSAARGCARQRSTFATERIRSSAGSGGTEGLGVGPAHDTPSPRGN
jgi:hypothetical protein